MKVIVASTNPVKIEAARLGFARVFPGETINVRGVAARSGVSDQPSSEEETLRGAHNRAENAAAEEPDADFWVGIEGGVTTIEGDLATFAWIVIVSDQGSGKSRTGTFFLPPQVAALVRQGMELGDADDIVFGRENSKQKDGAIGILTENVLDRTRLYEHAVVLALVPFVKRELYLNF